jgi:hypothetical protein
LDDIERLRQQIKDLVEDFDIQPVGTKKQKKRSLADFMDPIPTEDLVWHMKKKMIKLDLSHLTKRYAIFEKVLDYNQQKYRAKVALPFACVAATTGEGGQVTHVKVSAPAEDLIYFERLQ